MDIRARILARADLDDLRAARDLDGLTAALNAEGLMAPVPLHITSRGVRNVLSVVDAANFLQLLRSLSDATELPAAFVAVLDQMGVPPDEHFAYLDALASAHGWLEDSDGLDIGSGRARGMMDLIAATSPTKYGSAVAALKSLALAPVIADRLQIEAALNQIASEAP
jgi:hypothetical protein